MPIFNQTLLSLLPPPSDPIATSGNWVDVEVAIGVELPGDFKRFTEIYGAGTISNKIRLINPFYHPQSSNRVWENWIEILRDKTKYGIDLEYDLHPACPGVLPCGSYMDSNLICWLTNQHADQWRILYYVRGEGFVDFGTIGITDFLVKMLEASTGLDPNLYSNPFQSTPPIFYPYED